MHIRAASHILAQRGGDELTAMLEQEYAVLAGRPAGGLALLEELLCRQVALDAALRLACLLSVCGGLRPKAYDTVQAMLLHSYGYRHVATLQRLARLGLLRPEPRPGPYAALSAMFGLVSTAEDSGEAEGTNPFVCYGYVCSCGLSPSLLAIPARAGGPFACPISCHCHCI